MVNVPEDDRKPAAHTYHDNNKDDNSNCENDFEVGDEEDELDEDSDAVNDARTQFLFEDKNFYVDKEGDYHGDLGDLDNTLVAGGPKKTDCFLNMTAEDDVKAMADYQKDRKTYTDRVHCQRRGFL